MQWPCSFMEKGLLSSSQAFCSQMLRGGGPCWEIKRVRDGEQQVRGQCHLSQPSDGEAPLPLALYCFLSFPEPYCYLTALITLPLYAKTVRAQRG